MLKLRKELLNYITSFCKPNTLINLSKLKNYKIFKCIRLWYESQLLLKNLYGFRYYNNNELCSFQTHHIYNMGNKQITKRECRIITIKISTFSLQIYVNTHKMQEYIYLKEYLHTILQILPIYDIYVDTNELYRHNYNTGVKIVKNKHINQLI
jgi:hypothetical protein